MNITVNGAEKRVAEATTVLQLLESMGLDAKKVVVERCGTILEREEYGRVTLCDGDTLEVVRFVGGG